MILYQFLQISCHIERSRNVFNQSSNTLPKTDSISCHLDDRRDSLFEEISPRTLVEMTALMQLSIICTLCLIKLCGHSE